MANRADIATVLAYLGSAVGKPPTAEQAEVYYDLLHDLPADLLMRAAKRAAAQHIYASLPPVGSIRKHALDLIDPPLSSAKAYELAVAAVRRFGLDNPRKAMESLPPRVAAACRAYGWRSLCDSPPGVAFKQFCATYDAIEEPARAEAALPDSLRLAPASDVAALKERLAGALGMPASE